MRGWGGRRIAERAENEDEGENEGEAGARAWSQAVVIYVLSFMHTRVDCPGCQQLGSRASRSSAFATAGEDEEGYNKVTSIGITAT